MQKGVLFIGAVFVSLLMISTATAVPTTHSKPVMDVIDKIEEKEEQIQSTDVLSKGIFQLIWQILIALFNLIMKIIEVVNLVTSIIQLIQALVNGISTLFEMIQEFIDLINDFLNPDGMAI